MSADTGAFNPIYRVAIGERHVVSFRSNQRSLMSMSIRLSKLPHSRRLLCFSRVHTAARDFVLNFLCKCGKVEDSGVILYCLLLISAFCSYKNLLIISRAFPYVTYVHVRVSIIGTPTIYQKAIGHTCVA
jgi:hypothetical protein